MKTRLNFILLVIAFLIVLSLSASSVLAVANCYNASADPIPICTCDDLNQTRKNLASSFELQNHIDCENTSTWNSGNGWLAIGTTGNQFTGTFNGMGYNVSGLYIDRSSTSYQGLFGYVNSGTIANVTVSGMLLEDCYQRTGILAGFVYRTSIINSHTSGLINCSNAWYGGIVGQASLSRIINSSSTATVYGGSSSSSYVGGIVGASIACNITNSEFTGIVEGTFGSRIGGISGVTDDSGSTLTIMNNTHFGGTISVGTKTLIGGFVGYTYDGCIINNSRSTGNISAGSAVGGFVGDATNVVVENSYSTGSVTATNGGTAGGIFGTASSSTVYKSYSTSNVSGTSGYVGGLIGQAGSTSTINNSFARGNVTGPSSTGGLVGYGGGKIWNSYATGYVSGGTSNMGGIVGWDYGGTTYDCFWDNETSGQTGSGEGTGKSTADMKNNETFTNTSHSDLSNAWDFAYNPYNDAGTSSIWHIVPARNDGYPLLPGVGHFAYVDVFPPAITYQPPTPADNHATTDNTSVEINLTIEERGLNELRYDWNGTNHTMYNDSLVLMMNFDNVSALGEGDSLVVDMSQSSNNGTITNAVYNTSGKYGKALQFDGSGDLVNCGNDATLRLTDPMTLEAWFYWPGSSSNSYIISKGTAGSNQDGYHIWLDSTLGEYLLTTQVGNTMTKYSEPTKNVWHHVVVTDDGTNKITYYDGVLLGSASSSRDDDVNDDLKIGEYSTGGNSFNGLIDEVYIWNRALSADEIYQHYVSNLKKTSATDWELYINQSQNVSDYLKEGTYTYNVYGLDNETNWGSVGARTAYIDRTAPTFTGISNKTVEFGSAVAHNINATDVPAGIECFSVNDTDFVINCSGHLGNNTALSVGLYNLNITVNDTAGNQVWDRIWINISDTTIPAFTTISNQSVYDLDELSYDIDATDASGIDCFFVNDTNFAINCSGYLVNNTALAVGLHRLNITMNDTESNSAWNLMWVNVSLKPFIGLELISPPGNRNAPQNLFFNVTVNVSCIRADCGEVNVTLDPSATTVIYSDGFESGLGNWTNGGSDHTDWTRLSGATSSGSTGPSAAHTGDWYIYVEASSHTNEFTYLVSPVIDFDSYYNESIDFWWHMYGSGMGTMSLASNGTGSWVQLWSLTGDQGDQWNNTVVDLSSLNGSHALRFKGLTGATFASDMALDDINLNYVSFYTNVTNPYNISLNNGSSSLITWWVNSTGNLNTTHEFFVYANKTSDMSINNVTQKWNVTIREPTPPAFTDIANQTIEYGTALGYDINATDAGGIDCFTVNDTTNFKINCSGYLENNTGLSIGLYNLNIIVNDTASNINSNSMWVNVSDTTLPIFTVIVNQTIEFGDALAYDINATDLSGIDTYVVNDTTNFKINSNGYLENNTGLSVKQYNLNISVNDTEGNSVWNLMWVNVSDTTAPTFTVIANQSIEYGNALGYDIDATDLSSITFAVNDTTNFKINSSGYLENNTRLIAVQYWLNITVTDAEGNSVWNIMWVNVTDTIKPSVTLNTPAATHVNDSTNLASIIFNCSATDNYNLASIRLHITNNSNQNFALNQTTNVAGTSNYANWTLSLVEGDYTWGCVAYDSLGNFNWSASNRTINITDIPVNVSFIPPTPKSGETLIMQNNLLINVSFSGNNVTTYLYNSSRDLINSSSSSISPYLANFSDLNGGIYYFNATAVSRSKTNSTETRTILISPDGIGLNVLDYAYICNGSAGFNPSNFDAFDFFGTGIANIGDLDGDGIQDLAAGAYNDEATAFGTSEGAVYILFMNKNGTVSSNVKISDGLGGFNPDDLDAGDKFGYSFANIGDLDGDGVQDLAVGADGDETDTGWWDEEEGEGAVYILFMNTNGSVSSHVKISDGVAGFNPENLEEGDNFGSAVANIGDLDEDGISDLAVGAYEDEYLNSREGAVYILFMNTNGSVRSHTKISNGLVGFSVANGTSRFGSSLANMGDLSGDGVVDLAVGAYMDGNDESTEGAVYIVLLNTSGGVVSNVKISDGLAAFHPDELDSGDYFGYSVANIGDLDGDGVADMAVGAIEDNLSVGTRDGSLYILFFGTENTPPEVNITGPANNSYVNGNVSILVSATDNLGIQNVLFEYKNSTSNYAELCNSTTAPYTCVWETAGYSDDVGGYDIRATVVDTNYNNDSEIAHFIIDQSAPRLNNLTVTYPSGHLFVANNQQVVLRVNISDSGAAGAGINTTIVDITNLNSTGNVTMALEAGSAVFGEWSLWNITVTVNTVSTGDITATVYAYDNATPLNNLNTSQFTISIDNINPLWSGSETNLTTATTVGSSVYFNITFNESDPDKYFFSWYNGTSWDNDTAASYTSGQELSVKKTIRIDIGDINWTWHFNDTSGNSNQTSTWSVTLTADDAVAPTFTSISNQTTASNESLGYDINATDNIAVDCFGVNDSTNFQINCSGYLSNATDLVVGLYNLNITVNDSAGNMAWNKMWVNVTPVIPTDTTAPVVRFGGTTTSAGSCSQTFIRARVVAADKNLKRVTSKLYQGSTLLNTSNSASSFTATYLGLSDGSYTLIASAVDTSGNYGHVTRLITLDTTAPGLNLVLPVNGVNTSSASYNFTFNAIDESVTSCTLYTDAPNYFDYAAINTNASITSGANTTLNASNLDNRTHAWFVNCTDAAGNSNQTNTRNITVDQVAPSVTISTPSENDTIGYLVYIYTEISDALVGVDTVTYYMLNASNTSDVLASGTLNATNNWDSSWNSSNYTNAEFNVTFKVTANDTLGNGYSNNHTFLLDNVLPSIQLVVPPSELQHYSSDFSMIATAQDSALSYTDYSVSGTSQTNSSSYPGTTLSHIWQDYFNVSALGDGIHNITVYANDSAGNSRIASALFVIDTTAPETTINYPPSNLKLNSTNVMFNWTVVDSASETILCNLTVNNVVKKEDISCTNNSCCTYQIYGMTWRAYSWNVTCTDESSNNGDPVENSFTPDWWDNDGDNIHDNLDKLIGNKSSISHEGTTDIDITIGNETNMTTFNGSKAIVIYDDSKPIINFTHNFSIGKLDLRNITIKKSSTHIMINYSGQLQASKKVFMDDNSFIELCVKDAEVGDISEMSDDCSSGDEVDFTTCLRNDTGVTISGITCTDLGSRLQIEDLGYSAIRGTQSSSSGSSGGGGSVPSNFCGDIRDCGPKEICLGGTCRAVECVNSDDCDYGQYCFDNTCHDYDCMENSDCGNNRFCIGHKCYDYECVGDLDCKEDNGEICLNHACVKMFDIEIGNFSSPVVFSEYLEFTYFIKGVANVSGDVVVRFWLEKDKKRFSSGQDTIYVGEYEEKAKETELSLPTDLNAGTYVLHVQLVHGNYVVDAYRTLEIVREEPVTVDVLEGKPALKTLVIVVLLALLIAFICLVVSHAGKLSGASGKKDDVPQKKSR